MVCLGFAMSFVFERSSLVHARPNASYLLLTTCLLGSALLGGLTSFTSFWVLKFIGSLTMKVFVNARNLALVLFSVMFLGESCTAMQYVGYSTAMLGIVLYDRARHDVAAATMVNKERPATEEDALLRRNEPPVCSQKV